MAAPTLKEREDAWLWLLKIVAGVLIIVILGVHFVMNHWAAPEGLLNYDDIVRYYQIPYIVVMEITFVVVVVIHAFIGLRSIILDLNPTETVLNAVNVILSIAGTTAIVYGIWLILRIASNGTTS